MSRSAFGVLGDVVNFAPGSGDAAAGNDAAAVAHRDHAALMGGEDALGVPELDDAAVAVLHDPVHAAGAAGVGNAVD